MAVHVGHFVQRYDTGVMDRRTEGSQYWFPAKRYGWGWEFPSRWQGWVVLAVYVGITAGAAIAEECLGPVVTGSLIVISTIAFVIICWRTGEPPRWQWGDPRNDRTGRR